MSDGKKSGLKTLRQGEVLFEDGEKADSLYIIQTGQIRLYKPKGKGFVEIAVLRSGEVIGEMAYFDESGGGKRSCAASALVTSQIIEVSFSAFDKTMSGLNPWFSTIINTLAGRLRQTNARVRELESNSAAVSYSGKHSGYEFFKSNDVIKIIGTLFLVFKAHSEKIADGYALHRKTIDLYARDIYGIMEVKLEEMILILEELGYILIKNDKDGLPKILVLRNMNALRAFFIFYNTEKHQNEDKKLHVSEKCQVFLEFLYRKMMNNPPEVKEGFHSFDVSAQLQRWHDTQAHITTDNLTEAKEYGLVGEVLVDSDETMSVEVNFLKLQKYMPNIIFMNRVLLSNKEKSNMS